MVPHYVYVVLLTLAWPVVAAAQVPSVPAPSMRVQVKDTTRVEVRRFFEPQSGGGNPHYAFPANRLVATIMLITIAGSVVQLWRAPSLRALVAVVLVVAPVTLAGRRVVPNAMRLGARGDDVATQRALARTIWRDHVLCFAAILAFLALQL